MYGYVVKAKAIGKVAFLDLRFLQKTTQFIAKDPKLIKEIKKLKKEDLVKISFEKKDKDLVLKDMKVIAKSEDLPVKIDDMKGNKIYEERCLYLRSKREKSIMLIQSKIVEAMQEYLFKKSYKEVFTPCLMGLASESGAEAFSVLYYDREAFLRQDPQLHRQLTIASGFDKIFEIGPAWRAEQSHTSKHLCEHRVCAVEEAYIEDEFDVMKTAESIIKYILEKIKKDCKEELLALGVNIKKVKEIPVIEFPEVKEFLAKNSYPIKDDLDSIAEQKLSEYMKKKYDADFYFVNSFPYSKKPFYVMKKDQQHARSFDLYYKSLELSSGGQREHRYSEIIKQAKEKGITEIDWFAKHFRYAVAPHGGFAIGIERLTQALLNVKQIKDCVLFPRTEGLLLP